MDSNFPIDIGVKRGSFRASNTLDPVFNSIKGSILERDDKCCQACGFRSPKYMEVHHIDDNDKNNDPENLITLCCFCHATCHIGFSAVKSKPQIIYLPELSHGQWSNLLRGIYCASRVDKISIPMDNTSQKSAKDSANLARQILTTALPEKAEAAKKRLGIQDVLTLANYMKQANDDEYLEFRNKLRDFRIWHDLELYSKQIEHWCQQVNWIKPDAALKLFN